MPHRPTATEDTQHDLYVRYYDRVVGYLVRQYQFTSEEARDIAQDVFVSVFTHVDDLATITSKWLFLKTAAHNRAVNEIRKRETHRRTETGSVDASPQLAEIVLHDFWTDRTPQSPEEQAIHADAAAHLREAIEELPASLRQCVVLRMHGLAYDEIAAALRITANAVKTRLRDAKKLLLVRMGVGGG